MLAAVNTRVPFTVPAGGSLVGQVVEDSLAVDEVLQPRLVFTNFGSEDVDLTITRTLNLGVSANPEDDGSNTETVVSAQTIAAGESFTYTPDYQALLVHSDTPYVEHTLAFDGSATTVDNIIQMIISGTAEETTRTNILSYTRS